MLRLAAEVAASRGELDLREYLLGAVAIRTDGVIVSSKNGPANNVFPPCHAEARVLRKAGAGAILYVARVRRGDGSWGLAMPCKACMRLIRRRHVVAVYYTVTDDCYERITLYNKDAMQHRSP